MRMRISTTLLAHCTILIDSKRGNFYVKDLNWEDIEIPNRSAFYWYFTDLLSGVHAVIVVLYKMPPFL